jgi:hypothetical protein
MQSAQFIGTISLCVQYKDKKKQQTNQIYFFNFFSFLKKFFFLIFHNVGLKRIRKEFLPGETICSIGVCIDYLQ